MALCYIIQFTNIRHFEKLRCSHQALLLLKNQTHFPLGISQKTPTYFSWMLKVDRCIFISLFLLAKGNTIFPLQSNNKNHILMVSEMANKPIKMNDCIKCKEGDNEYQ